MDVVDKSGPFMSLILHRLDLNNLPRVTSEDDAGGSEVDKVEEVDDVQVLSDDSNGDGGKDEGSEFESEGSGIQGTRRSGRLSKKNKKSMKDLDSESEEQTSSERGRAVRSRKRKKEETDESDSVDVSVVRRLGRRSGTKNINYAEKALSDTKSDLEEQDSSIDSIDSDLSSGKSERGRSKGSTKAKNVEREKPHVHEKTEIHPVENSDLPGSIKRGRGRPRKNKTEKTTKTISSDGHQDVAGRMQHLVNDFGGPTQKKRGRPRKNQTPSATESFLTENPIPYKKTPGRQDAEYDDSGEFLPTSSKKTHGSGRRYVHDSSSSEDLEDSKPKIDKIQKKDGRPRKNQTPVATQSFLPENQEDLVTAVKESVDAVEVLDSKSEDQTSSKRGRAIWSRKRKKDETHESDSDDVSVVRRSGRRDGTNNINYAEKLLSDTKSDLEEQTSSSDSTDSELSWRKSERGQPKGPRRGRPKGPTKVKKVAKEKPHSQASLKKEETGESDSDDVHVVRRSGRRDGTNNINYAENPLSDTKSDLEEQASSVSIDSDLSSGKSEWGRPKGSTKVKKVAKQKPHVHEITEIHPVENSDLPGSIKRGRGRPRKIKTDKSNKISSDGYQDVGGRIQHLVNDFGGPTQKKRGRPRKNQTPVPTKSSLPANSVPYKKTPGRQDAESDDSGEGLPISSKKTPGRRYVHDSSSSEDLEDSKPKVDKIQKKGGRPSKNQTPVPAECVLPENPIPSQKTPGRRYVHHSSSSEDSEDSKPKVDKIQKKRGRPRKNQTPSATESFLTENPIPYKKTPGRQDAESDDSGEFLPTSSKNTHGRRYVHDSSSSEDLEDSKPKVDKIQKKRGRPKKIQTRVPTESFPPENPILPKKTPGRRYVHDSSSSEDLEDVKPKVAKIQNNPPETLKAEPQLKGVANLSDGKFMLSSSKIMAAQSKLNLASGGSKVKLRLP